MLGTMQSDTFALTALLLFTATTVFVSAKLDYPSYASATSSSRMPRRARRDDRQPGNNNRVDNKTCKSILSIAIQADIDSSGGLNIEEFYGFFNIISSDYFESKSNENENEYQMRVYFPYDNYHFFHQSTPSINNYVPIAHSYDEIFFRLVGTSKVKEEEKLEVSLDGFDEIEKEKNQDEKEYRRKFCNAVVEVLEEEGVSYASIDFVSISETTTIHPATTSSTASATTTTTSSSNIYLRGSSTTSYSTIITTTTTTSSSSTTIVDERPISMSASENDAQPKADSLAKRIREESSHLNNSPTSSMKEEEEGEIASKRKVPSTGVAVAVYMGIVVMVMLIVFVVTHHPFFDPRDTIA